MKTLRTLLGNDNVAGPILIGVVLLLTWIGLWVICKNPELLP